MSSRLNEIVQAQKRGEAAGIASICSAHPWVLKSALAGEGPVLIESTCQQVNQFGGYTGMTPAAFAAYIQKLAREMNLPGERLILGGDHLGPNVWQEQQAEIAMGKAAELVQAYVRAGYTKIHLDASMRLGGDDSGRPLDLELTAERTAVLARAAEAAAEEGARPVYVIGTEVPPPGGAISTEESARVTRVEDVRRTLEVTREAFEKAGLEAAWGRVLAVVVQPGVEFGDQFVRDYDPEAARDLARFIETTPLVYEAHSTDYQTPENLRALVRDHFAILKVGPALTFAFREAVFGLAMIEAELIEAVERSSLRETLEAAMLRQPAHWIKYYTGSEREQALARRFSLSDRARYYWPDPVVQAALGKLLANLEGTPMPLSLLSQYAPDAVAEVRSGRKPNCPASVIEASIERVMEDYRAACRQ